MSSKRDRNSRSGSPDPSSAKGKRVLDLVSTRRYSPPGHHQQRYFRGGSGRGRPSRRPFVYRGTRGTTVYRGASERYYPRYQRYNYRDDSHYRRRRSRSRSHSKSRERSSKRSESRDRRRRSESDSSSSDSESRHRRRHSKSHEHRRSSAQEEQEAQRRASHSPEDKAPVKKKSRRHASPYHDKDSSNRSGSGSQEKQRSHDHRQHRYENRQEEEQLKFYTDKHPSKPEEEGRVEKYRRQSSPLLSAEVRHTSRKSEGVSKGKELIPRNRLHKIFSLITQDTNFELDEDISIAIQRNPYAEPSEDSTVTVVFDEELFSMIYPYEGRKHKPIFDREEIQVFGHDKNLADDPDFERRVIRVKPGKSSQQSEAGPSSSATSYQYKSSLEIVSDDDDFHNDYFIGGLGRTVKRNQSSSRSRSRSASPTRHRNPQFRLRVSTDPRFEARYAELQRREEIGSSRRSNLDPNDLRHELSSSRKSTDARSRLDREKDRQGSRRMSAERRDDKPERKKEGEELPDYSRRKDKYQYTPWLDQPELIPKDPKYFLHDDRENMDMRNRGRGRFMRSRNNYRRPFRPYRSRGTFRGPYRGRGNYINDSRARSPRRTYSERRNDDNRSVEREWKHDKFSELETDGEKTSHRQEDEHPHSTSER